MSKKCKEGSSLNVDTNRCRKDCKENQERNPKTKRCRNICTDTQYRNDDKGRCRNVAKEKKPRKGVYVPQPLDEGDLAIYDYMPTLYNVSNIPDSMPFNSLPEVVESISSKKEKSIIYMVSIALSPMSSKNISRNSIGLSPMSNKSISKNSIGLSPMSNKSISKNSIGLSPMNVPSNNSVGVSPMSVRNNSVGVSPMSVRNNSVGVSPMSVRNNSVGVSPMSVRNNSVGVSPMSNKSISKISIGTSPINVPDYDYIGDVPFPEAISPGLPDNYLEKLQEMLAINLQDQPVSVAIVEIEQPILPILENTPEVKEKIFVVALTELDDNELDDFIYETFAFEPKLKEPMNRDDFRAGLQDNEAGVNVPITPPRQTFSELMRADDKPKSNENNRVYIDDVKRAQETLKPIPPLTAYPSRQRPIKKREGFGSYFTPLPPRTPTPKLQTPRTPLQTPSPRNPLTSRRVPLSSPRVPLSSPRVPIAQFPPPPTTAIPDYVRKPNRLSNALSTAPALLSNEPTFQLNQPQLKEPVFKKNSSEISQDAIEKAREEVRDVLEKKLLASIDGAFGEDSCEIIELPVSTRRVAVIPIDNRFGITPTIVPRKRPATALDRVVEEDTNFGRIRPATANAMERVRQKEVFDSRYGGRLSKVQRAIENIKAARGAINPNPFGVINPNPPSAPNPTTFSKRF
jgi:hypothetical protein